VGLPGCVLPSSASPFPWEYYVTAIANAMKAGVGDHEVGFGNEDYEDSSELEEIQIEETQNEVHSENLA
jgi:hypothetical protein